MVGDKCNVFVGKYFYFFNWFLFSKVVCDNFFDIIWYMNFFYVNCVVLLIERFNIIYVIVVIWEFVVVEIVDILGEDVVWVGKMVKVVVVLIFVVDIVGKV